MRIKNDNMKKVEFIKRLENDYNFKGPLHFTDYSNLKSIFASGYLSSREDCCDSNTKFLNGSDDNIINKTGKNIKKCVRFYYKECSYTLYSNEGIKKNNVRPHLPIPVYLLFDKDIMLHEDAIYSDGCAGSSYSLFGNDLSFLKNIKWDIVFSRGSIPYELPNYERREVKRIRQAELLMRLPVDLKYLKKVIFRSKCDYKRAINDFGKCDLFTFDRSLFHCNNNFVRNYKVIYDKVNNGIEVKIRLNKYDFNDYKYYYSIIDENNREVKTKNKIMKENPDKQTFSIFIENYNKIWSVFRFYINDIMCIDESIKNE